MFSMPEWLHLHFVALRLAPTTDACATETALIALEYRIHTIYVFPWTSQIDINRLFQSFSFVYKNLAMPQSKRIGVTRPVSMANKVQKECYPRPELNQRLYQGGHQPTNPIWGLEIRLIGRSRLWGWIDCIEPAVRLDWLHGLLRCSLLT